jgi:putative ABC transport system permease protein
MIKSEIIKYSLRNLKTSRDRSLLTIFSILIGITTIFIFVSFGLGLYQYVEDFSSSSSVDKILVQAKGIGAPGADKSFSLTKDDIDTIKKVSGVYEATGVYYKAIGVTNKNEYKYIFLISYDPEIPIMMETMNVKIIEGRNLRKTDKGNIVAGYNYQFPEKVFDREYKLNDNLEIDNEIKLKIIGFYGEVGNPSDDSQIYVTNEYYEELYPNETSYAMIVVKADRDTISNTVEKIEKALRNSRGQKEGEEDFFVQSFEDMIKTYGSILNIIVGFVILIALISVLVSAVNTANTMITSVLERYKEIGVLKSIGARNSDIFKIFLFESSVLGFVAGVIGTAIGFILSYIGKIILADLGWSFLSPAYSPELFIGCILFATITGSISGVIPAMNASKINTVDALRYE